MFQLIVAVISIALVAILAIASIYYGGSAFQKSGVKAQVDALVNAGQQISGAQSLYTNDFGTQATTVSALLASGTNGTYLSASPAIPSSAAGGSGWTILSSVGANGTAYIPFTAGNVTNVCAAVVSQAGGLVASTGAQFYCSTATGVDGSTGFAFKL